MHYLPFMAAITLSPGGERRCRQLWRGRGGGGAEGERQPAQGWRGEPRRRQEGHLEGRTFVDGALLHIKCDSRPN